MSPLASLPPPSAAIDEFWMAPYIGACLTVADEVGIFELLKSGPLDATELARATEESSASIVGKICKVLVASGWLIAIENRFGLTEIGRTYCLRESEFYRGLLFKERRNWSVHLRVKKALAHRWAPGLDGPVPVASMWARGEISPGAALEIANQMHQMSAAAAEFFAHSAVTGSIQHLLDLGGGNGTFSISFARQNLEKSATIMDLPALRDSAEANLKAFDLSKRVKFESINFFSDDWILPEEPSSATGMLLSNVLHDWSPSRALHILKNCFRKLPAGGSILIHEMLLDTDGCGPLVAVAFDLMMGITHGGQQFSFFQIQNLLVLAGFKSPRIAYQYGNYHMITAQK